MPLERLRVGARVVVSSFLFAAFLPGASGQIPGRGTTDDGQWTMAPKDYANSRYSGLSTLIAECLRAEARVVLPDRDRARPGGGADRRQRHDVRRHAVPELCLCARPAQAGRRKVEVQPKPDPAAQGVACCDVVNRGAAYAHGKIFFNTLDEHTIAVDAETGKELWNTKLGDINNGETMTMAPLVVKGKVLVGNSGGEFGVRGWLTALDADDRQDRLARLQHRPRQRRADRRRTSSRSTRTSAARTSASRRWPPEVVEDRRRHVWGWISYDPELDLIYYGTGNPGPWNPDQRPGDNKWTCRLFARDPDTGEAVWATSRARTTCTTTTRSTRTAARPAHRRAGRARCSCTPSATATST